jgi:hypothetical protein
MALWSGQGAPLSRDLSAADLMQALIAESERTLRAALE